MPVILLVKWQSQIWVRLGFLLKLKQWNQVREWFANHLEDVNRRIHLAGQDDEHKGMGTTLEALAFVEGQVIYAHVGDSQLALFVHGEYRQLTSDHSLVNALLRAGQITEEEAAPSSSAKYHHSVYWSKG